VQNLNRQQHVVYDVAPRQQEWILECHSDALARPVEPRHAKQNFTTGGREQAAEELEQPVFPQPLCPMKEMNSPLPIRQSIRLSASERWLTRASVAVNGISNPLEMR
jgi:hypothetical protein